MPPCSRTPTTQPRSQRALAEVLSSPARRAELEQAGLARAREFSWLRCADLTVAAYRRAVGH